MDTAAAQLETVAAIADALPPATLRALLEAVHAYGDARADALAAELAPAAGRRCLVSLTAERFAPLSCVSHPLTPFDPVRS